MRRILLLIFLVGSSLFTFSQNDRISYLWNSTSVVADISPKSSLSLSLKTHYLTTEHFRDMSYVDLSVSRTMNSWFKLGLAFRTAQLPKENGDNDVYEYRPQVVTTLYCNKHKVKYRLTNRLEHRWFSVGESHFRYYQNFFIDFPSVALKLPKPYVGEELFTKLNGDGAHIVRLYSGLHMFDWSHLGIDMYYVWQKSKSADHWGGADIFGMNLKFKI